MPEIITPFVPPFYIGLPDEWIAWSGWLFSVSLILWGTYKLFGGGFRWKQRDTLLLIALLVATLLTSFFLGMRLPATGALPPPGRPEEPRGPALMFLIALPWMIAGGVLGAFPAVFLGALSGLILAFGDTHSLFTPVEMAGIALLFSITVRQRYRTAIYRLIRHPLCAAVVVFLLYIPIYLISISIATTNSSLVVRVDYALTHLSTAAIAAGGELAVGGFLAEILFLAFPRLWGRDEPLKPSPVESSLQLRFFYGIGPLVLALLLTLMIGDWVVAGDAARSMLRDRLASTAQIAAESIPFFLEAGQNLILQIADDPGLLSTPKEQLPEKLHQSLTSVPYFRQLYLIDQNGKPISGYPEMDYGRLNPSQEEQVGIQLALKGIEIQVYTLAPVKGESTAQVSFIKSIKDGSGVVQAVIIGRSDLASNPFTKPIIETFEGMKAVGEYGIILDENGRILYHPVASRVMTTYSGQTQLTPEFFAENASDGTRNLVYYQPTLGRSWAVVLAVPAQRAQQMALTIAIPLMVMILLLAVLTFIFLRVGLRVVTASLQNLAGEAGLIAQGELDHALPIQGEDEVGHLRQAFERMRIGLKARLEELNQLLIVSQGVASSLEMQDAVQPILDAALADQAVSARIVINSGSGADGGESGLAGFGIGPMSADLAYLDGQILGLSRNHPRLILSNLTRGRGLSFTPGFKRPGAVLALALKHEMQFYGTLWIAYDAPRTFSDEEVRFAATLAGQAALAAINARLYTTAEIGRQRLEAILAATPDPVLVTDQQNRVLLSNPAALQLPGLNNASLHGKAIDTVISQKELVDLLLSSGDEQLSREINFPNGRVYYATVSAVEADGQPVGKVCLLRNITHFKEVDTMKSDFVATVSHDLRSPLTLMRGYATMLQMVGELNEQQKGYVRKIIGGVESMSRLVNSLLDLDRVDSGVGLQVEKIPANEIVERVVGSLQLQAAQKNIKLEQALPVGSGPVIEADPSLLQQALYNLVENGIKYTPVAGQVTIHVDPRAETVVFQVHDTRLGIAPLDQPRLFEKFYRAGQRETNQPRGSGLGLAIVKSITERHGGKVWLESNLGKGSTFFLEVPYHQDEQYSVAGVRGD